MSANAVLMVEDDDDHADLAELAIMKRIDVTIVRARDGEEALDYLFQRGAWANVERPKWVLLDLNLPKCSGLEVLAQVKSAPQTRAIPIVMMTTSASAQDRETAYANGVNSYLVKPMQFQELSDMLGSAAEYWTAFNHNAPDAKS